MQRPCATCGITYEAKTAKGKFCSTTCRTRSHKNPRLAEVKHLPASEPAEASSPDETVTGRTRARLVALELDADPQAAVALVIARRLDSDAETGAAIASLAKQYAQLMDDLSKRGKRAADPLDEITARILSKAQGA